MGIREISSPAPGRTRDRFTPRNDISKRLNREMQGGGSWQVGPCPTGFAALSHVGHGPHCLFCIESLGVRRCKGVSPKQSPALACLTRHHTTPCLGKGVRSSAQPFVYGMLRIMHREFQCPSCGATNEVTNPGIIMRVCDYCKTAMYWDEESVLRAGRKSVDLPPSNRFRIGGTGKIGSRSFRVLGRLSYAHDKGTWDEWFVEMQDGTIEWLTEDEEELFLETPVTLTSPVPPHEELRAGMRISLNDKVGLVEEIGRAQCIGGEGQIPFVIEIGETYPYADGSGEDGSFSFGLEYDSQTGTPTAFVGTIVPAGERGILSGKRGEAVAREGRIIRCLACGKPYEGPRVATTRMVVCAACGSADRKSVV